MIKKKLFAFISTLSLVSVVAIATAVSANAANVELKYNEELSNATLKVVDVNYNVDGPLWSFGGTFVVDCPDATVSYKTLVSYDTGSTKNGTALAIDWSDLEFVGDVASSGTHGQLNIVVPEGTSEFDVSFNDIAVLDLDMNEYPVENITITIPGATVEPTEETVDAVSEGMFTYWQDAPAAQAFSATLTAEQAAKSVTWNVTKGEDTVTKATTVDTTVSGEADVVIGLVVSNAVEGLSASVVVK